MLAILEEKVTFRLVESNRELYENKGIISNAKNGKIITVNINDLYSNCGVKVTKICDICGKCIPNQPYVRIIESRNQNDGKDRCKSCAGVLKEKIKKGKIKYEDSAEYYFKSNNLENVIELFSSKNDKKLSEISRSTSDKYLWNCPVFGDYHEFEMEMLLRKKIKSCPYCAGKRILIGYNDLWTTSPETAKLLLNPEDGYYHTKGSGKRLDFKCPDCGCRIKNRVLDSIVKQGLFCDQCSDGISLPEKFIISLFGQTNLKYETQKVFIWSKNIKHDNPNLCGDKRYDGFLTELGIIIEIHGKQHYEHGYEIDKTLDENIENDLLKIELAERNNLRLIVIDAKLSDFDYLKTSVINNDDLKDLINFSEINWNVCWEFACSSFMKKTWDLWNIGMENIEEISKKLNLSPVTVREYLKKGSKINKCKYDPIQEKVKSTLKLKMNYSKPVMKMTLDGLFIEEYESIKSAARILNIQTASISKACIGKYNSAGGYKWLFKDDFVKNLKQA